MHREMNKTIYIAIVGSYILLMFAVIFFYVSILKRINYMIRMRRKNDLELVELNVSSEIKNAKINLDELKKSFKFSGGLIVMSFMYLLHTFSVIILSINIYQEKQSKIQIYSRFFIRFSASATPIVYPIFHASIRRGFTKVFRLLCCLHKKEKQKVIKKVVYIHRRQLIVI